MKVRLVDTDENRDDFMRIVYEELSSDLTNDRANRIIDVYDNLLSVDAAPVVYGRWNCLDCDTEMESGFNCSQCGSIETVSTPYCFCCGAKMDLK